MLGLTESREGEENQGARCGAWDKRAHYIPFNPCLSFRFCFLAFRGKPSSMATANPVVLNRFRAALNELYGNRIERVVLYGSRARGDAREDSDYDVAVFLKDLDDRWAELDKLAIISSDITTDTGEVIHAMAYRAGTYQERTPLMHELRREGIDI